MAGGKLRIKAAQLCVQTAVRIQHDKIWSREAMEDLLRGPKKASP